MSIYMNLVEKDMWKDLIRIDAIPATDEQLALAHTAQHIQKVKDTVNSDKTTKGKNEPMKKFENTFRYTVDTYENKFSAQAAYLSAGGTIEAVRAVCSTYSD